MENLSPGARGATNHSKSFNEVEIMNERTINIKQASEYLGCSRSFIYKLYSLGKITGYRNGDVKGLRFYMNSIKEYQDQRFLA
jgi:excisionase family DNA binding protein